MELSEFVPKYSSTRHWFGRIFSATGMSVDPAKITAIVEASRPTSVEEVRSLIQAAAYNAKFMFDHTKGKGGQDLGAGGPHLKSTWGDQRPLLAIYNIMARPTSVWLDKHRRKVQDLDFTDKYLPCKEMPCDFNSRHPNPINHLTEIKRLKLGLDDSDDITIRRIFIRDLPDAVTQDMI